MSGIDGLPTPDPDRRRTLRCLECDRLRQLDPEVGICPDCYVEALDRSEPPTAD